MPLFGKKPTMKGTIDNVGKERGGECHCRRRVWQQVAATSSCRDSVSVSVSVSVSDSE